MATYDVRWVTRVEDAESFFYAAKEAWADLIQTMMDGKGATMLVVDKVEGEGDEEKHTSGVAFDMEKPWSPTIVATNKIDRDDPEVVSAKDEAECVVFEKVMEKMHNLRNEAEKEAQTEFLRRFDGPVN
jgi:hypothetical protein